MSELKKYCCDICNYKTSKKTCFTRHLLTEKHKINIEKPNNIECIFKNEKKYECICGKIYKYDSGFYRHKKNCNGKENEEVSDKELIKKLLEQNSQLIDIIQKNNISFFKNLENPT